MRLNQLILTGTLAFAATASVLAQSDTFTAKDKNFLRASAQSDMAEMNMANLALQKSSNDDIKTYANQMIADHTKMHEASMPVAQKAGLTPPSDVDAQQKRQAGKLQGMSGDQFDKAYVRANVLGHDKVLRMAKSEEGTTQNSDMKTLLASATPIVQDHATKATELAKKIGVDTNSYPSDESDKALPNKTSKSQ